MSLSLLSLTGPKPALTLRELDVLELVAEGLSTKAVAARLYLSHQAVTYHLGNLLAKLQCRNRTGLVARAYVAGILRVDRWPPRATRQARGRVGHREILRIPELG